QGPAALAAAPGATPKPVDRTWHDIVDVVAGEGYTAALRDDGQVLYAGRRDADSLCAVEEWAGVERLYRSGDEGEYLVGLCFDGTALAIGPASAVAFDLSGYTNVQEVVIGQHVAAVLQGDCKVRVAAPTGPNVTNDDGVQARYYQQRTAQWAQIRALCFSHSDQGVAMLAGLCADGTVTATDRQWADDMRKQTHVKQLVDGPRGMMLLLNDGTLLGSGPLQQAATVGIQSFDAEDWTGVAAFCEGADASYVLTRDGRLLAGSRRHQSDARIQEALGWTELVQLGFDGNGADRFVPAGLRADGTVLTVTQRNRNAASAWDTSEWTGVTRLYSGAYYTLGLRADGTVLATGGEFGTESFVEEVAGWTEIAALYVSDAAHLGSAHVVGLRYDGKLVAAGCNDYGECSVK
ncbi:MAG: hypothetical protein IJ594_00945, partial [Oscillospiraceae bacterium]|nr:hypothetical protein [Oscillospiraceae bacterium]